MGAWAASLPLVAGLLCYHGLVLWCVGLQLCHWSLRSARAWVLGGCPGLGPPPGHAVRPRRVGLRPLLHWPRSAARLVVGGRAPVRLACNAPRQLVGIRVLLIADGSSFGVRHVSPDQFAQRSGPRCGLTSSCSFALAHCESCTAPRGVAVELKASPHDSASISRCSKLLRSTSRAEHYWRSTSCSNTSRALQRAVTRSARERHKPKAITRA